MKKTVWTFGLISGALLAIMLIIALAFKDQIGFDRGMVVGYSSMVLASLFIYFGVRSYRDNVQGGTITFGRAMAVGSLIAIVSAACYVATWEVIYFKFDSDYLQKYQAYAVDKMKTSGATEAQVQAKVAEMEKLAVMYQNPLFNSAVTFLEPLPVGLLFALVSAGLLSRRKRNAGAQAPTAARA